MFGGHSAWDTPDTIPNSEVKPCNADDSVKNAKVGHCQASFLYVKNHIFYNLEQLNIYLILILSVFHLFFLF